MNLGKKGIKECVNLGFNFEYRMCSNCDNIFEIEEEVICFGEGSIDFRFEWINFDKVVG